MDNSRSVFLFVNCDLRFTKIHRNQNPKTASRFTSERVLKGSHFGKQPDINIQDLHLNPSRGANHLSSIFNLFLSIDSIKQIDSSIIQPLK